jgi:serine O-acetyltransferase
MEAGRRVGGNRAGTSSTPRARSLLARLDALFDTDRDFTGAGTFGLIVSDYLAFYSETPMRTRYQIYGSAKRESPRSLALKFIPRLINNPSLHACVLIRLAVGSPRWMLGFWRTILLAKHTIEIAWKMDIGPGLLMPHPYGIGLSWGIRLGRNVTLMHYANLGALPPRSGDDGQICPVLGDDVIVFTQGHILGPVTIGDRAVIGAGTWVEEDVEPDAVVRRVPK